MLLWRRRGARVSNQPRDFEGKSEHGSDTMGKVLDEDLVYEILSVVAEIPAGRVASYGQIARLISREKNLAWSEPC